ncbi:Uma2 family endonuclease [Cyclobacterium sp.]|uniref:Uma2 family endonuclease n=1 Tax=Cyclobacterium sp. TaxID=1966343 RepID=UPI001995C03B|nr:Uma2 family endonuclease [Cyclobacterium sp.]MBD3628137.1 Uma2 family endonuclease [Cyclobacterium sp.]
MEKDQDNSTKEPISEYGPYSYADYLRWELEDRMEIIKGRHFKMNAAPKRLHQKISLHIATELYQFLKGKACEVYEAPFDVRLPVKSLKNEEIFTVVQPDICVVCNPKKLDEAGCLGAPELIVEILSPGNNKKELQYKYEVYQESGVKEYWIIHPDEQTLLVYTLTADKYVPSRLYTSGDIVKSDCIEGFALDLELLFSEMK